MFDALKLWKLGGALKARGDSADAYSAVLELGRVGTTAAADLLIGALARNDGVARSAARELGRLRDARAVPLLVPKLAESELSQAAMNALVSLGEKAVPALIEALRHDHGAVRALAAMALGDIRDERAVEPLVNVLQADDEYAARTAAATALGQLKSPKAIWALVNALRLRDEPTPERQTLLEQLRVAATLAMRKIGTPLHAQPGQTAASETDAALQELESNLQDVAHHPRLLGDARLLSDADLIAVLKELVNASEEISWANLESREPMLPAYFKSYDQRRRTAEIAGDELRRRGGPERLRTVLEKELGGHQAIVNWWADTLVPVN